MTFLYVLVSQALFTSEQVCSRSFCFYKTTHFLFINSSVVSTMSICMFLFIFSHLVLYIWRIVLIILPLLLMPSWVLAIDPFLALLSNARQPSDWRYAREMQESWLRLVRVGWHGALRRQMPPVRELWGHTEGHTGNTNIIYHNKAAIERAI